MCARVRRATIAEIWARSRWSEGGLLGNPGVSGVKTRAGIRLPFSALRRTQLGMMFMGDKLLFLWTALYVGVWMVDILGRHVMAHLQLMQFTFMTAIHNAAFLSGKPGEFLSAIPLPRARTGTN